MKKLIKTAGISLLVLTATFTASAAEAAQKIGFVQTAKVFQALPQREAVSKKLQSGLKDQQAQLDALQKKIETKVAKLQRDAKILGEAGTSKLRIEIGSLQSEYKIKAQSMERDARKREGEEKGKLYAIIQTAIEKVAEKQGYDVVIDASALQFAKAGLDITDEVIKEVK